MSHGHTAPPFPGGEGALLTQAHRLGRGDPGSEPRQPCGPRASRPTLGSELGAETGNQGGARQLPAGREGGARGWLRGREPRPQTQPSASGSAPWGSRAVCSESASGSGPASLGPRGPAAGEGHRAAAHPCWARLRPWLRGGRGRGGPGGLQRRGSAQGPVPGPAASGAAGAGTECPCRTCSSATVPKPRPEARTALWSKRLRPGPTVLHRPELLPHETCGCPTARHGPEAGAGPTRKGRDVRPLAAQARPAVGGPWGEAKRAGPSPGGGSPPGRDRAPR